MRTRTAVLLLCAFLLAAFPATSHAIGFELAIGGWQQGPAGEFSYQGETLDLEDDNNYEDSWQVFGRLKLDMPMFLPNVYLMATPMEFDGTGSKDIDFRFGDRTFTSDVDYYSDLKLSHYDVALYYGLPFLDTATAGVLNVELGLNARIIDFSAEVRQDDTGIEESKAMTLPVPMVYLGARVRPVEWLGLEVEARGITYGGNHYYDLIGRVKATPIKPAFVAGGWRHEDIKIDEEDVLVEVTFSGPFIEAGVEF